MRDTQTTPYISMKALERMPVQSIRAPNMMGRMKPPRPPARPTMPLMAPMFLGKSSLMDLKTLALPKANATPSTASSPVKAYTFRPMWKVLGPLTVAIMKSVCG